MQRKKIVFIIPDDIVRKRVRKVYAPATRIVRDKTRYNRQENRRMERQEMQR